MKNLSLKILFTMIIFLLITPEIFSQSLADQFRQENGNEWQVAIGPWNYINYVQKNIPEITGNDVIEEQAKEIAESFLDKNAAFFGVESYSFVQSGFINMGDEDSWMLTYYCITFKGEIPPSIILKIVMTRDDQIYAMGDEDMFGDEPPVFEPPVTEDEAIESAQEGTGINQEPSDVNIQEIPLNETESKRVSNITFGLPENKEVIVDATTGEILSIKSTASRFDLNKILELLKSPYSIVSIILILIVLIGVISFKKKKTSSLNKLKIQVE